MIHAIPDKKTKIFKSSMTSNSNFLPGIISTIHNIHKIKIKELPVCYFCKRTKETIEHLFLDCYCVKEPWELYEEWLLRNVEM